MTFANLDQTDALELPGCRIVQEHERLGIELADGSRIAAHRDTAGAVRLRLEATEFALPPEAALRLGAHLAALSAATLEGEAHDGEDAACSD